MYTKTILGSGLVYGLLSSQLSAQITKEQIQKAIEETKENKTIDDKISQQLDNKAPPKSQKKDNSFLYWTLATAGSTAYDVETTFRAIHNGAVEGNPIVKPFIERGRGATYAFEAGIGGAALYFSHRMKSKGNRNWYIIPLAMIATHAVAGTANLRFNKHGK